MPFIQAYLYLLFPCFIYVPTHLHHISAEDLENRVGLRDLHYYLRKRRLLWAGKVIRMDFKTRLPRKLLTSWVYHQRRKGATITHYGKGLHRDLKAVGICEDGWEKLAASESAWLHLVEEKINSRPRKRPGQVL